jgi:hypothetical protein
MSEEFLSRNQPIRQSTEKQSLVTLIGLGALLLIIELYTFGAHHHNRFYAESSCFRFLGFLLFLWSGGRSSARDFYVRNECR